MGYLADSHVAFTLPPSTYVDPEYAEIEREKVLRYAWYPVGATSQLTPGANLVTNILDIPIVVRGTKDGPRAFRNVCTHRGCQLISECGQSERMKCGYHGWEYHDDGRTGRIPQAKNFPHFDREAHRLAQIPLARCGDLWFVQPDPQRIVDDEKSAADLKAHIGPNFDLFAERFAHPIWKHRLSTSLDYDANWKIPIEGSLESYHIPCVHPKTFGEDPGDANSQHVLDDRQTTFITSFRKETTLTKLEDWILHTLGTEPTGVYQHHHVFPNLLFSVMDTLTLTMAVVPTGPETSRGDLIQFTRCPKKRNRFTNAVAWGLSKYANWASKTVLEEDAPLFPKIQAGQRAAASTGEATPFLLGRCEERLDAFQRHVDDKMRQSFGDARPEGDTVDGRDAMAGESDDSPNAPASATDDDDAGRDNRTSVNDRPE